MRQIDFLAATLPVVELTDNGLWVTLGTAHGVTMSRHRVGRGWGWQGAWKTLELENPGQNIRVLRWQTDKIIVQRLAKAGCG